MALPGEADIRPDVYVGLDSARRDFSQPRLTSAAASRRQRLGGVGGDGRWRRGPRAKARG
jgi:hypothetical protein